MSICIVSSCGGHLTEVRMLIDTYNKYKHFYVLNDRALLPMDMKAKTLFIKHSERDILFFYNLFEAFLILFRYKPKIILSTGAGPVVPFALVGKYIFNIKIIYIESITRINKPSLTGKIMYKISDDFFYQWESLKKYFPEGKYFGPLI